VELRADELGVPLLGAVLSYGALVAPLQGAFLSACAAAPVPFAGAGVGVGVGAVAVAEAEGVGATLAVGAICGDGGTGAG